jgi:hypothetical protein
MELTLEEICERLAERFDEISLLEHLKVNSYELVEKFKDRIEDDIEYYQELAIDEDTDTPEDD